MGLVIHEFEVIKRKVINPGDFWIDLHGGERIWGSDKLLAGLIEVVRIQVEVAEGVDEISRLITTDLRDHESEKGVRGYVKWNPEEEVGAALVKLAAQAGSLGIGIVNVKLKKEVAGRQGHFINLTDVPG